MPDSLVGGAYLHHLEIETPQPEVLARFYGDAMDMGPPRQYGDAWVCAASRRRMSFIAGEARRLSFCAFSTYTPEGLDALRCGIERDDTPTEDIVTPFFPSGAFAVRDPDGNRVVFGFASETAPDEKGLRGPLQHLTLATLDPEAIERFYVGSLGFRTSDYVRDSDGRIMVVWMRSNHEHHTLACFRHTAPGIDHHSYEAADWSVIKNWSDRMGEREIPLMWGPGRHGPGNNIFIFVEDPDRNWIEISAELEIMYGREPRNWSHAERTLNLWGRGILRISPKDAPTAV